MTNSQTGKIKVISENFVKPNNEAFGASNQHYYLGPNDLATLSLDYMKRGLVFTTLAADTHHQSPPPPPPPSSSSDHNINIETFLEKLNHSLSLSLLHFYPLAGRLATQKFPDDHASFIFIDCTKGPGARILHATLDLNVSDLLFPTGHIPEIAQSLFDLGEMKVNHDGHTHPLLSIQVTELLDGIVIGFTINHAVADGTSLWHFVSVLSKIFLGQIDTMFKKPIFKPFFPDGYGPILKVPYLDPHEFVTRIELGPLRERIFHFSPASMAALKAKANQECGVLSISSFQALSGLLWRSITRARKLEPSEETNCSLLVNTRSRFDPPFSEVYFGNYLGVAQSTCTVGEILGHDLGWAAMIVHKSVAAQNEKRIRGFWEMYCKAPSVVQPGPGLSHHRPNPVLIGGSTKFDMYGPQFGFGRAVTVFTGLANMDDWKVNANPGREGGGSVDLQVGLRPETMSALESDEEFMSYVS